MLPEITYWKPQHKVKSKKGKIHGIEIWSHRNEKRKI